MLTEIVKNGLNRVEVRDLGLILWENDATPLISIFRPVLDQQTYTKYNKQSADPLYSKIINNHICSTFLLIYVGPKLV